MDYSYSTFFLNAYVVRILFVQNCHERSKCIRSKYMSDNASWGSTVYMVQERRLHIRTVTMYVHVSSLLVGVLYT